VAETKGLVQRLKVAAPFPTYFDVGPSLTNTVVFFIKHPSGDGASGAMVAALASAMVARWEVVVTHGDNSAEAVELQIEAPSF
jgi:hypothetical protein